MTAPRTVFRLLLPAFLALGVAAESHAYTRAETDSLLAAARSATGENRFERAVVIYEGIVRGAPSRLPDVSPPLAYAYVRMGRLEDARREFRRASVLHPGDFDLRLGELSVLNWMGRHLEAWEGFEHLRRINVTDPAPVLGLAAAQNWSGRRDLSRRSLAVVRGLDPGNADAGHLAARIDRSLETRGEARLELTDDGHGFRTTTRNGAVSVAPHPQFRLSPFYAETEYRSGDDPPLRETRAGAGWSAQPWTRARLSGSAALRLEASDDTAAEALTGTIAVEVVLDDRIRAGLETRRFSRPAPGQSPRRVEGSAHAVSLSLLPDHRSRVVFDAGRALYEGGGRRTGFAARGSREIHRRSGMEAGFLARLAEFDPGNLPGLWSPDRFWAAAATLEFAAGREDEASIAAGGAVGPSGETEEGSGTYLVYWVRATRAWGPFLLEARYGRDERDPDRDTGYARTGGTFGASMRF